LAFLRQEGVYANTSRPQLLLLHIGIPKIDGWEVLETIRATPALATLPVVMLTGSMSGRDEERRAVLRYWGAVAQKTGLRRGGFRNPLVKQGVSSCAREGGNEHIVTLRV
jgi:CheY-like chemotaxis protein